MIQALHNWYKRYLGSLEAGNLVIVLAFIIVLVSCFSKMLAPVFASIVIAYLLDWSVSALERWCKLPHMPAVIIVCLVFVTIFVLVVFSLFPLLIRQLTDFLKELPQLTLHMQKGLEHVRAKTPFISDAELQNVFITLKQKMVAVGQHFVSISLASIPSLITFVVYFVMTPLLIYFFLMDRDEIITWVKRFMPHHRTALTEVVREVHVQIGNYVRGKVLEAIIVGVVAYICFAWLGLQYAALLAAGVGLSVFIPYIGAVLITIPVVIVGIMQWGFTDNLLYLLVAYGIILALDGTVLVAVLFSGTNNLHPIIIIIATLVFGGIWGFWGIFFAIPLASLVKALMEYWPVTDNV